MDFMNFLKNLLLSALSDFISFILLYKFIFLLYSFSIVLTVYFTKDLRFFQRFYAVLNNILFVFAIQMVRLLAPYLNGL